MSGPADWAPTNAVPVDVLERVTLALENGGSPLTHLHEQLGVRATPTWTALARAAGHDFFEHPSDLGPLDARLLPMHAALDHLCLPRVRKFQTIYLITPDPMPARAPETLTQLFTQLVPGGEPRVTFDVTTPDTFRELFTLLYPDARAQWRGPDDVSAMTALLPAGSSARPTPETHADALATFLGVAYVDPVRHPPDPHALGTLPLSPFLAARLYPHQRDERGRLAVLGAISRPDELTSLEERVSALSGALLHDLTLRLTSFRRLAHLLAEKGTP